MHRTLALIAGATLATVGVAWAGCSSSSPAGTGGSVAASSSAGPGGSVAAGGAGTCLGGAPDGTCEIEQGETCDCADCTATAFCVPGMCMNQGTTTCDHVYDSCTCSNCSEDPQCADPGLSNCRDGGACYPFTEGCHCPNCWGYSECQASVAACAGGKPDGVCAPSETCDCVDCQGTPLCAPCANLGVCDQSEPCDCVDCIHDPRCNDTAFCVNDGVCAAFTEGCICDDCKSLPQCTRWLDGGTDASTDSGTGGASSSSSGSSSSSSAASSSSGAGGSDGG